MKKYALILCIMMLAVLTVTGCGKKDKEEGSSGSAVSAIPGFTEEDAVPANAGYYEQQEPLVLPEDTPVPEESDVEMPDELADLRGIVPDQITKITYSTATEAGALSGSTTDPGEIQEIYARLCSVGAIEKSDMAVDDDGLTIVLTAGGRELKYSFEGDIFVGSRGRFKVVALDVLKGYINTLLGTE
ncbi:MAG: hypothetical protein J6P87_05000 [Lachnospiraceae bacterium]|nr:hypothetical protein [Lachnospiraceae bacterium]